MGGHDEREQTLNQLLVEMDGFDARKASSSWPRPTGPKCSTRPCCVPAASTATCWSIGPTCAAARRSCKIHVRNVKLDPTVDLRKVAARTAGFVGADLANLVNEAALLAARRDRHRRGHARLRRGDRTA